MVLVDRYNLDKEHPWIVAGSGVIDADVHILLRSTKCGYGGIQHEPHNGACGVTTCRINERGWISDLHTIESKHFILERKSCKEPCEKIIEYAMQQVYRKTIQKDRRHNKTRKRR